MWNFVKQHLMVSIVSMLAVVIILTLAVPLIFQASQAMENTNLATALNTVQQAGYRVLGAGVNLDGDLLPSANNTWKLGNTSLQWSQGWFNSLHSVTDNTTTLNAAQITDSSLTNGQVVYAGAGGALQSNSGLTYNPSLNTLISTTANVTTANIGTTNGTQGTFTTANVTTLNAPTGRGATYVIAASNATATEKAQADVVCTGSGDESTINAATVNYDVKLTSGTFNVAHPIWAYSNHTIEGSGLSTTIFLSNGANSPVIVNKDFTNSSGGNTGIIIKNINVSGNKANNTEVSDEAGLTYSIAIYFDYVTYSSVEGVTVTNAAAASFTADNSSWLSLKDNTCVTPKSDGISLQNGTHDSVVSNNRLIGPGDDGAPSGVEIQDGSYNINVTSNVISNWYDTSNTGDVCGGVNIAVHPAAALLYNINVVGNVITSSAYTPGVYVAGRSDNLADNYGINISGNTIYHNAAGRGIYVIKSNNVQISSNVIEKIAATSGASVAIETCDDVNITGNTIRKDTYAADGTGIYADLTVNGLTIANNTFFNAGFYNMNIRHTVSNLSITGNVVNTGGWGVFHNSTDTPAIAGGLIANNTFTGMASGPINSDVVNGTVLITGNKGYINSGEVRTYSGSIVGTAGDNGAIMLSVDNPFGQAVKVTSVAIEVTVQASAAATMDAGIGSSASADYTTMIAALPINPGTSYPYFYDSVRTATYGQMAAVSGINWATGSGNRYLNFFNPSANASGTVFRATYVATVMGE